MNEDEKKAYLERYKEKKADGEMFFPDTIAKDAVMSLAIFVVLILLATLVGVPKEPPANPSDSSYIPRPEWYFLWMFQLLKYFPGQMEGIAIVGLGLVLAVGLFGLPFFDRNPKRHPFNRPVATVAMLVIVAGLVGLTVLAVAATPPQAEALNVGGDLAARIEAGGKLYQDYCATCHGADGEGGEIENQPGEFTSPLNDQDFLATHSRETLISVIDFGWQSRGMSPFGLKYGGALTDPDIKAIVDFIQAWYVSPEAAAGAEADAAALAQIEKPSFSKDVQPILAKRCASCHGARKKGGYSVADYNAVMTSGDNAPVIIAGDAANSILVQQLHGIKTAAGGQMPPSRPLQAEQIKLIERWVNQGAQNN